jgi:hypothetical protein
MASWANSWRCPDSGVDCVLASMLESRVGVLMRFVPFGAERALFPSVWIYNQIRKSDLF